MKPIKDIQQAYDIEQFYFREARLLDDRKFQTWMELLAPGIEYVMPNRKNALINADKQNDESALSIDNELGEGLEPPLRYDDMLTLSIRCNRPTSPIAWADNPLARTRRCVSNIEPYSLTRKRYRVFSNTMMSYSRHAQDNYSYCYHREDTLEKIKGELKIAHRRIILDWNVITAPTIALIF